MTDPAPSAVRARTTATAPPAAKASAPLCPEEGVKLAVSDIDGAMGLRAVGITLRNCGKSTFTINGYPLIQVLDEDRKVLEVAVLNGTDNVYHLGQPSAEPKRVDVAPGGSAQASMLWRNLTTDGETVVKGAYINIATSSGRAWQLSPLTVDLGNTGKLAVGPWMAE
jgi:hypothetical protein